MTGDRVNIKVPPHVHEELDADRDMSWPDYLLHLKRMAGSEGVVEWAEGEIEFEPVGPDMGDVIDRIDDLEARLPRKVAEELSR